MTRTVRSAIAVLALAVPAVAAAQDIRGLEICTAEKSMERRTSCLQSNVEFLQQTLAKQGRETKARLDAAQREAAVEKAELAALKAEAAKLFLAGLLLWLVLALYRDVVVVGLLGSFVVSILIFSFALFAGDET